MTVSPTDAKASSHTPDGSRSRSGRGCMFWGCTTLLLVVLIAGGSVTWVVWGLIEEIDAVASAEPVPVPEHAPTPGQLEAISERLEPLDREPLPGDEVRSATLDASDLNALIHTAGPALRGRIYVTGIDGDRLEIQVSVPLDRSLPGLKGRWFNGTAVLRIVESQHGWAPRAESLRTHDGQELSGRTADILSHFAWALAQETLAQSESPQAREFAQLARVEVRDGKVVLTQNVEAPGRSDEDASPR